MKEIPTTYNELYYFARFNGFVKTKKLLREYVDSGQPDYFMGDYTSRALCRCAGHGLSGKPINRVPHFYLDTKHGRGLYAYMFRII